ncbi:hypothetical protein [Microseira wollei]|uniref:hypothetical protein n=1 Tax=Microseira wollei TaxID=467598 RepID=UPI001CFD599A|nr:hypothetical protein [Microseira wollei]
MPVELKTALRSGISSPYGRPLFNGDPDGILPLLQTLAAMNPPLPPLLAQWLQFGTPPQFLPLLQGTPTSPPLPADVVNAWNALNPQQRQQLLRFLPGGVPPLYHPLLDGTDPDRILPIFNALNSISSSISANAPNTVLDLLPDGIPSEELPNFP